MFFRVFPVLHSGFMLHSVVYQTNIPTWKFFSTIVVGGVKRGEGIADLKPTVINLLIKL